MSYGDDVHEPPEPLVDPEAFQRFTRELHQRLEAGAKAYGDASLERPVGELLTEIREELLDVCGWSWVLLQRIERLQQRVESETTTCRA